MEVLYFIFTCLLVLATASLYLRLSLGDKTQFDKVISFFLVLVSIHVAHALLVRIFPYENRYIDKASPLGLIYGPIVFFAYLSASGYVINKKTIFIHLIPFIIIIPFYSYYLLSYSADFRNHSRLYYGLIYGSIAISWFSYSLYIFYKSTVERKPTKSNNLELTSIMMIILFMLSFFKILNISSRLFSGSLIIATSSAVVLSLGMFGIVLSVFLFTIKEVKNKVNLLHPPLKNKVGEIEVAVGSAYEKSGLEASAMEKYAQKINHYFSSEQYLDPSFNLNTLSSALKIPRHSLSQVFSQYYGQSFLKHINSLRIMHACQMLEDPNFDSNIEDLAEQCGFNSSTSFYRNFKEFVEMTPTEYQNWIDVNRESTL